MGHGAWHEAGVQHVLLIHSRGRWRLAGLSPGSLIFLGLIPTQVAVPDAFWASHWPSRGLAFMPGAGTTWGQTPICFILTHFLLHHLLGPRNSLGREHLPWESSWASLERFSNPLPPPSACRKDWARTLLSEYMGFKWGRLLSLQLDFIYLLTSQT